LRELLPKTGGLNAMTTRSRTVAIGTALEAELCQEIEHPQNNPDGADHLMVGIDGAFVKVRRDKPQGRAHCEILTGRIERERGTEAAFAIVRDLDGCAKQKVQAVYPKPKLSPRGKGHQIYPYLLRGVEVKRADQVWGADFCTWWR
jgi:hypothetical protein